MVKKEENIGKLETVVSAIRKSEVYSGMVDVLLEPTDSDTFEQNNHESCPWPIISASGQQDELPPGLQQMMMEIPSQMKQMMKNQRKGNLDPRSIIFIEDEITFKSRGWVYGDKIVVTFKKKE